MDDVAKEFLDSYVRIPLRAKVKDSDTFGEAKRKIAIFRDLTAVDMASIKLAAGSDRQELLEKLNRRNFVPPPKPPSPYDVAKREAQAKEVRRRARLPVVDLTGSPEENERTLRRLDAEDEREARSGITDDDDEAGDERRPEDVRGTAARPIDLTREPAKSKTRRARVAPRKARKGRR